MDNKKKLPSVLVGVELGDTVKDPDQFVPYLEANYDLDKLDFVLLAFHPEPVDAKMFSIWAEFFVKNNIYFAFLYTQMRGAPEGRDSQLTPEIVKNIYDIAGDYFLGDMIGETCGDIYWPSNLDNDFAKTRVLPQIKGDMNDIKKLYIERVARRIEIDRKMGIKAVMDVEASACQRYNIEAGVDIPVLEMMCSDPEKLCSFIRGNVRVYDKKMWGCHVAHDWYGGLRNGDPMKYKRLKVAYNYAYLAGADMIYLEGGDSGIYSYGDSYSPEHPFCQEYRRVYNEFAEFVHTDKRPIGNPMASVAFVNGNLDSFSSQCNSAAGWCNAFKWNQRDDADWAYDDAERSWNILNEVRRARPWHDVSSYGVKSYNSSPAWGQYDCIPTEATVDAMLKYKTLIFAGWNTMTDEILEKLMEYVAKGGTLMLSAAHLSTCSEPGRERKLIKHPKLEEFLGCSLDESGVDINSAVKFRESIIPDVLYPATKNLVCDAICAAGHAKYAKVELKGGYAAAILANAFNAPKEPDKCHPVVIENKYGKGYVCLLTNLEYPGAPSAYPVYIQTMRAIVDASHAECPINVAASDKITYAVYPNGDSTAVYLANTDFDLPVYAEIVYPSGSEIVQVEPCGIKRVDIPVKI